MSAPGSDADVGRVDVMSASPLEADVSPYLVEVGFGPMVLIKSSIGGLGC
jgi:hypothetical protein